MGSKARARLRYLQTAVAMACSIASISCAPERGQGRASPSVGESIAFYVTEVVDDAELARSDSLVGALEHALLADLTLAGTSIDAAIYSINRESIVARLLDAATRGVRVRVATECENRYGAQRSVFDRLLAAGIPIVDDRSAFQGQNAHCPANGGSMHHKFLIVDDRIVWMGSTNMTWSGFNYNKNHLVRLESASVVDSFRSEFEVLFSGSFGRNKFGGGIEVHQVGGAEVLTAFSPYNLVGQSDTRQLVLDAVGSATKAIRFGMFYFTDDQVQTAIANKADLSRGIMDAVGAADSGSRHHALCASGVEVKVENFPGKLHHKLAVFDAGTDSEPQAIVGSTNWTKSGFEFNDESMLLVHGPEFAREVDAEYAALYHDAVNHGLECCNHSAEGYNALSASCGDSACVCTDGIDNDFDGRADTADSACTAPFVCDEG